MIQFLLLKFWPALVPIILYALLICIKRSRQPEGAVIIDNDAAVPARWTSGPWGWVMMASLLMLIASFVVLGLSYTQSDGDYVPPHMQDGELVGSTLE